MVILECVGKDDFLFGESYQRPQLPVKDSGIGGHFISDQVRLGLDCLSSNPGSSEYGCVTLVESLNLSGLQLVSHIDLR